MSKKKKKNKPEPIEDGLYTIYWEIAYQYDSAFVIPGVVNNVRGYQFTGTRQEVALHIQFYLKHKDNLTKIEVKPFRDKKPKGTFDLWSGHWHTFNGEPQLHAWADCPNRLSDRYDIEDYINGKEKDFNIESGVSNA